MSSNHTCVSITALSAELDFEAMRISNDTFLVDIRTTIAFTLSGAIGRDVMVTWKVPAIAVESKGIVNCVGLVTVTAQLPSMPDIRELLTYVIWTCAPFVRPCGIGELTIVGTPLMQLNVMFYLYTPSEESAGLFIEAATIGSTAIGMSKFCASTTEMRYWLSLNVSVVLFFSSYMPGTEKFSR